MGVILRKLSLVMRKLWERSPSRFFVVGSFNTLIDFTILNLVTVLANAPPLVANSVSVTIGITISYFLNHKIVFRHHEARSIKSYALFFLTTGISALIIQNLIIYLVTSSFNASEQSLFYIPGIHADRHIIELNIAKAFAVGVGMIWNFLFYRYIIFSGEKVK